MDYQLPPANSAENSASALIVVPTTGGRVDRYVTHMLIKIDHWIGRTQRRASILLSALILAYATFWTGITTLRHHYFHSGYDLATQDQVVWNTSQGRPFVRSLEVNNDLADHVRPYLAFLSLAYVVFPSPHTLLVFQALALALTAWPLYCLSKRKLNSPAAGLTIAFCSLAYPPLGFLNRTDFHSDVVAVPLLVAAYERIDARDLKTATFFMGLALLGKESIGLAVAVLGLLAATQHNHWRFGLVWMVLGMAYSLVALFLIIPAFRGAPSDTLARYQWMGTHPVEILWTMASKPGLTLEKMLRPGNLLTSFQLLAPLGFLPLFHLQVVLPALPALIYNYLSDYPPQRTIYFHYMAPVIPFLMLAGTLGLYRFVSGSWLPEALSLPSTSLRDRRLGFGLVVLLTATLASWAYENPVTARIPVSSVRLMSEKDWSPSTSRRFLPNDAAVREALQQSPADGFLLTTSNYLPHLSHRPRIANIRPAPLSTLDADVEAILLNLKDLRHRSCEDYFQNLRLAALSGFGVTFYRDGVVLVQKGKGDRNLLKDLLTNWPGCI